MAVVCGLVAAPAAAFDRKPLVTPLDARAFHLPELYISSRNAPLDELLAQLPNRDAWEAFRRDRAAAGHDVHAFIDPRSGAATNVVGSFPLIPGGGAENRLTLDDLGASLGRAVEQVDARVVAEAARRFLHEHQALLGVETAQVGSLRAAPVADHLWQVSAQQEVDGVRVRDARLVLTVNHGNVVVFGTETWGAVSVRTQPALEAEAALEIGFDYAGGRSLADVLRQSPRLEIVPVAPQEHLDGEAYAGPVGAGYGHRLAWTFAFQRPPEHANWEVLVDAHSGEVIAFQDTNHYALEEITGGVYPVTSTGGCPNAQTCGSMQSNWPMPWAYTGLPSPDNYTNGAGVFDFDGSGSATTTLSGPYVRMSDNCGSVSASSATGGIALGGANNQHDCTTPGTGGAGNTPASRSGFYELNKIAELARGWLAGNGWIRSQLTSNMNINLTCNAFWDGYTVNFYRSGGGCRNTGEIAAVFDHEWGHGLYNYDSGGFMSNSSEGYADIAGILRLQTSCVGHGFFSGASSGCGSASDGSGPNRNESQTGTHCDTNCSGVRDADYARHSPATADTPLDFVCTHCSSGSGPCGKQVHCSAAPTRQAAWDFATRDLTAAPFSYDSQTAFMIANKVFYQGSGNVGTWHACTCGSSSSGCGSTNGYMQWLAADDDNGNLNDGTPHMTALYNAFNRHGMACTTPSAVNSGCAGGPTVTPALSGTAGPAQVSLSWDAIPGATSYWVMRTEGHAGCNFGKARIAEVGETSFVDAPLLPGRSYSYNVVAQGASSACFTRASNCVSVTPQVPPPCDPAAVPSLVSPSNGAGGVSTTPALDWSDVTNAATYGVQVATDSAFANVVASSSVAASTWTVADPLAFGTTHYWRVRSQRDCGAVSAWSAARSFGTCSGPAAPTLVSPASGATNASLTVLLDWNAVTGALSYEIQVATDSSFSNVVRGTSGLTATQWTVSPGLSASTTYYWRVRALTSCGVGAWSATRSFTTLCVTLQPPAPSSPASGASGQAVAPLVDWADVTSAERYDVQLSTTSAFTSIARSASALTRSEWTVSPDLSPATTYYWRARAVNNCSTSSWSSYRYFTTCTAPAAPLLSTPYNSSTNIALTPVVDWANVSGALSYDVEVGSSRAASGLTTSQWTVSPALSPNTSYSWRARAVNACAPGVWSSSFTFSTCAAPGTPTHNSPAYGASGVSTSLYLYWNSVTGATSYEVQVASDSGFSNVVRSKIIASTSWGVTPALGTNTTYYWRIRAYNSCTNGSWSGYRYFVTGNY
jgi:hypothetical protein